MTEKSRKEFKKGKITFYIVGGAAGRIIYRRININDSLVSLLNNWLLIVIVNDLGEKVVETISVYVAVQV